MANGGARGHIFWLAWRVGWWRLLRECVWQTGFRRQNGTRTIRGRKNADAHSHRRVGPLARETTLRCDRGIVAAGKNKAGHRPGRGGGVLVILRFSHRENHTSFGG